MLRKVSFYLRKIVDRKNNNGDGMHKLNQQTLSTSSKSLYTVW